LPPGLGFAAAYKNTGLGGGSPDKSSAEVELYPDGCLQVRTSAAELGQGLVSVLQMIVAEEFSVPLGSVRVLVMDTDLTPDGGPTTASGRPMSPAMPPAWRRNHCSRRLRPRWRKNMISLLI